MIFYVVVVNFWMTLNTKSKPSKFLHLHLQWARKVGSIRGAEHMQVSRPIMHASYHVLSASKSTAGMSYLHVRRLVQIADSLHKSTLCREGVSSYFHFHPPLQLARTTGPHSWICICICIADEKVQRQMRIQDHWACPNMLSSQLILVHPLLVYSDIL